MSTREAVTRVYDAVAAVVRATEKLQYELQAAARRAVLLETKLADANNEIERLREELKNK
jgi:predicted  nucleic acid-binding Zn-ribbon protein